MIVPRTNASIIFKEKRKKNRGWVDFEESPLTSDIFRLKSGPWEYFHVHWFPFYTIKFFHFPFLAISVFFTLSKKTLTEPHLQLSFSALSTRNANPTLNLIANLSHNPDQILQSKKNYVLNSEIHIKTEMPIWMFPLIVSFCSDSLILSSSPPLPVWEMYTQRFKRQIFLCYNNNQVMLWGKY